MNAALLLQLSHLREGSTDVKVIFQAPYCSKCLIRGLFSSQRFLHEIPPRRPSRAGSRRCRARGGGRVVRSVPESRAPSKDLRARQIMKSPGRKQRVKKRSSPVRGRKKALGFSGPVAKPLSHDRGFRVDWQGRGKSPKAALPSGPHPREFVAGANSPRSPTAEKRVARGMSPTAGESIPPSRAINQRAIFLEPRWEAGEKKVGTMPPMGMVPTFRMGRVRAYVTVARSRRGRPRLGLSTWAQADGFAPSSPSAAATPLP